MPVARALSAATRSPRTLWWSVFGLLFVAGAAWSLAMPRLSGADESDHAIRAAAVARGQILGGETSELLGSRNVFISVEVPEAYGNARTSATCFLNLEESPAPTPFESLGPPPPCTSLDGGRDRVSTTTLQYRGQPTYYGLVGLGSLVWPDGRGITAMRLISSALTAAVLASALTCAWQARSRLLVLAVLSGATPVCLWLSGQVNTGGIEIAAAATAFTTGIVLARAPAIDPRDVARFGVALSLLILVRGLSPLFAGVIVAALALVAGRERVRDLLGRRDVRVWAGVGGAAMVASVGWLAYVQLSLPLDPRPGTGLRFAAGLWDWYLLQTVGVFGVNDVVLPWLPVVIWLAVVAVVVGLALADATWVERAVVAGLGLGAFTINFTAEGLSLPPIGYFWQGRYVLPLLVGVPILAAGLGLNRRETPDRGPTDRQPGHLSSSPRAWPPLWYGGAAGALVLVHGWAFAQVSRHMAGMGTTIGFLDAIGSPRWSTPMLPAWLWCLVYLTSLALLAAVVLTPRPEGADPLT